MKSFPSKYEAAAEPLYITEAVMDEIRRTIGDHPAERGGVLGGAPDSNRITHFHFDSGAETGRAAYSPNVKELNDLMADSWNPAGIRLKGFVHSHPAGYAQPSGGDELYSANILRAIPDLNDLALPIVMTVPDTGEFSLHGYVAERDGEWVTIKRLHFITEPAQATRAIDISETFDRVRTAYDLDRLSLTRVIVIGTGGSRSFVEDLARAGVGEFVLIDPDEVCEANIATQHVSRRDVGRKKVDALADQIRDINPKATVRALAVRIEDIPDHEFRRLIYGNLNGWRPLRGRARKAVQALICGMTDSFEANARVNRLALQFGAPSLCCGMYHRGLAGEVTFTYPGVTESCHRCCLSGRYKAYVEEGFKNDVTSHGSPIMSASRLNSLLGSVAMALIHHGSDHPRWGSMLARMGQRNLVQLRMSPDAGEELSLTVFDRVFKGADRDRLFFDETVWLPQKPDRPENGYPTCPDCSGTGNLSGRIGRMGDTREMRS